MNIFKEMFFSVAGVKHYPDFLKNKMCHIEQGRKSCLIRDCASSAVFRTGQPENHPFYSEHGI